MAKIDPIMLQKRNDIRKEFLDGQISESAFIIYAEDADMPLCDIDSWIDYVKTVNGAALKKEQEVIAKQRFKAHRVMTPEEYEQMVIVGWHEVCKDFDGCGGVGVRFLGDKRQGSGM